MPDEGLTIGELGAAIGKSIADAQTGLTAGIEEAPRVMAIADATLELKVAASTPKGGSVQLHTISPDMIRKGTVEASALSTISLRFAALTSEVRLADKAKAADAVVNEDVSGPLIEKLNKKPEVKRLKRILGDVEFRTFAAGPDRFRVEMLTDEGRPVREFMVERDG